MIKKVLSPIAPGDANKDESKTDLIAKIDYISAIIVAMRQYRSSLETNFTLPICLLAFPLIIYFNRLALPERRWIYFLLAAYALLAVVQTLLDAPPSQDFARAKPRSNSSEKILRTAHDKLSLKI